MSRIVLSLLVDNTAGVLSRVAGLFSRRGYNIESLTVGVTADPRYSRMTVVSLGSSGSGADSEAAWKTGRCTRHKGTAGRSFRIP